MHRLRSRVHQDTYHLEKNKKGTNSSDDPYVQVEYPRRIYIYPVSRSDPEKHAAGS